MVTREQERGKGGEGESFLKHNEVTREQMCSCRHILLLQERRRRIHERRRDERRKDEEGMQKWK